MTKNRKKNRQNTKVRRHVPRGDLVPETTGKKLQNNPNEELVAAVKDAAYTIHVPTTSTDEDSFDDLIIHDHTKHRIITDAGTSARHFQMDESGKMKNIRLEVYVPKREYAGSNDMRLVIRSMQDILTEELLVAIFCKNRHWIINPQETADVITGLMIDGIIDADIADAIFDKHHPVWSRLSWEQDTKLEEDFIEHWKQQRNLPQNRNDTAAKSEFRRKKPNWLQRKEGTVTITEVDNMGKERSFTVNLALEKALLDVTADGRHRYFLASALEGSPFRSQFLKMEGWKGKTTVVRGLPERLNQLNLKGTPKFLKNKLEQDSEQLCLGDMLNLQPGETFAEALARQGGTISWTG